MIRSSDDTAAARARLMSVFDLSEVQANYILEMPLRRLTKFSRIELETERDELPGSIAELDRLLRDPGALRDLVSAELAEVAAAHATPRRTVLLEGPVPVRGAAPCRRAGARRRPVRGAAVEHRADRAAGRARTQAPETRSGGSRSGDRRGGGAVGPRGTHDVVVARALATVRGQVGVVTSAGRVIRAHAQDLPGLPDSAGPVRLAGGAPLGGCLPPRTGRDRRRPGQPASRAGRRWLWRPRPGSSSGSRRAPGEPRSLGGHPARRGGPRGRRGAGRRRTSWCCCPTTRSSCASPPRRSARRGGPPAGWPGSSCPPARGSSRSASGARARRGRGHRRLGLRGPARRRRVAEGHHRAALSREGPGHRRRAGAPLPQGRGRAQPRVDHHLAGGRRQQQRGAHRPARAGRPAGRLRAAPCAEPRQPWPRGCERGRDAARLPPADPWCPWPRRDRAEPMAGTAPRADVWVAVEHPHGWGDAPLARAEHGVRVVMARPPRGHERRRGPGAPGPTRPGPPCARHAPGRLRGGRRLGSRGRRRRGVRDRGSRRRPAPAGLRQRPARPVLRARRRRLAASWPSRPRGDRVDLTSTHLGGHRFAPTALLLPFGALHGRLDVDSATAVLSAARSGHSPAATLRG